MALYTEEPAIWAPTVRALQAPRVKVAFQPEGTAVIVQQVGYGEIDHTVILPHVARWLHMSRDIHIESLDNRALVRFRVDGVLQEMNLGVLQESINKNRKEIISRIKILGKMDISEKRRPQD